MSSTVLVWYHQNRMRYGITNDTPGVSIRYWNEVLAAYFDRAESSPLSMPRFRSWYGVHQDCGLSYLISRRVGRATPRSHMQETAFL
eukprot:975059-Rhodomonas_salina.3